MRDKIILIPKKMIIVKREPIRHLFRCEDGFMLRNLRFKMHIAKWNPPKMKLHIQIWLPFFHVVRDNSKWEIGNRWVLYLMH